MDPDAEQLLRRAYKAFNARDADGALALMTHDVDWPNVMENGRAIGHEDVRRYWLLQWSQLEPHVAPRSFSERDDGRVAVEVHQVVKSKKGEPLADRMLWHVYALRDGKIARMEIEDPA